MSGESTPAGWYPDPQNPAQQRYWDGSAWSEATQPVPGTAPPAPPMGAYNAPMYSQPVGYGMAAAGPPPQNYLVWAILTTLFCCLPAGIVSIVKAASVNSKWNAGDVAGAQEASNQAKTWAMISAGVGLVVGVLYFIVVAAASGSRTVRRWELAAVPAAVGAAAVGVLLLDPVHGSPLRCPLHELTGWHCPGCGATRATWFLLHGDLGEVLRYNALYLPALAFLVLRYLNLVSPQRMAWAPGFVRSPTTISSQAMWGFLGVVLAFTVARNLPTFAWLAPPPTN